MFAPAAFQDFRPGGLIYICIFCFVLTVHLSNMFSLFFQIWYEETKHIYLFQKYYIGRVKWKRNFGRKMCRFRSSCTCAKYHLGHCSSFIHSVVSNDSVSGQWGPDQTARMRRLIWAFAVRMCPKTRFRLVSPMCNKNIKYVCYHLLIFITFIFILMFFNNRSIIFISKDLCTLTQNYLSGMSTLSTEITLSQSFCLPSEKRSLL